VIKSANSRFYEKKPFKNRFKKRIKLNQMAKKSGKQVMKALKLYPFNTLSKH
jgi:hypothetical protein